MATASGLALVGGAEGNDPLGASTVGTGELIDRALEQGARTIVVGLGGSATTDGGLGAIDALRSPARLRADRRAVACDVRTTLRRRGRRVRPAEGRHAGPGRAADRPARAARRPLRATSTASTSRDARRAAVRPAGWPAGWPPLGGRLVGGFDLVAEHLELDERVAAADVVVTGEGYLDAQSLDGKVVGGVCDLAAAAGGPSS